MRLILILVLTGLLALVSMPEAAMAHGVPAVAVSDYMTGGPDCPGNTDDPSIDHDCRHVTGCGAMVMISPAVMPAAIAPQSRSHDRAGANLLNGVLPRIDLPPPRPAA